MKRASRVVVVAVRGGGGGGGVREVEAAGVAGIDPDRGGGGGGAVGGAEVRHEVRSGIDSAGP